MFFEYLVPSVLLWRVDCKGASLLMNWFHIFILTTFHKSCITFFEVKFESKSNGEESRVV